MNEDWLPRLIGLGTQKGGTSTLNNMLKLHKKFYLPNTKEIHYFTKNWDQSIEWYKKHYENSNLDKINVDITPYYLFYPKAAIRMKEVVPNAKLIVLLRDPVERTISQYYHAKRLGFETLSIMDAIVEEEHRIRNNYDYSHQRHSYIGRSRYIEQLHEYEQWFKKDQFLIIKSEDYFKNPREVWRKIEELMDLEHQEFPNVIKRANAGKGESLLVDNKVRGYLRNLLKQTAQEVEKKYGISWGWT